MRPLAFALVVLGLAGPASAQSRFVEACVASSSEGAAADRAHAEAVCACGAERALLPDRGLTPARLDALVDFVDPEADRLSLDGAPEAIQETAILAVAALTECLVMQEMDDLAQALAASASGGEVAVMPEAGDAAPTARVRPAGLRTGNGGGTVRSTQHGLGAAVRVVD